MLHSIIISPVNTGTDDPPGITALSLWPSRTPPAISSRSLNGVPIEISKLPGLFRCPDIEKHLTPPLFGIPRSANHCAPFLMIDGAEASDSVLLIVVGLP